MEGISSSSLLLTNLSPSHKITSYQSSQSSSNQSHLSPQPPSTTPFQNSKNTLKSPFKTPPKKFSHQEAFPQSLPLDTKNPSSIYKEIQNLARQNKLTEALNIIYYLDTQGIPINTTTFSSLISACIRVKSLPHARRIHTHVKINGLHNNDFITTKLVHMYSACGSMQDAQQLFDEMSTISVHPLNALLRGNVVRGGWNYSNVLDTYSKMRELGVEMNVYTYSCLIKSFAGAGALHQGMKVHGLLVKNGFGDGSVIVQTSLIDFYFKCRKIRLARQVFDEVRDRDVVVWGAMIAGFAHNRLYKESIEYLRWMVSEGMQPNSVILTSVLPVVGELWALQLGKEIHAYAIKTRSYGEQRFIQSGLIDMYCKCGDMASGRRVFYTSRERNVVAWTALVSGYISNGRLDQALRSVIWMQQEGVKPDVVTMATVIPVCAELKALKQGKEIHGFVVRNGFLPNVSLVTSLMIMYSRSGCLGYSCRLFDGMERRNVISWTAMIDSYLKNNCLDEALNVFRSMQLSKHRPDFVTISRILNVCGEIAFLKLGKEIHGHVLRREFASIPFVSAETIRMYGRCGDIEKAKLVFELNPFKGSITWTAIIEAYGHNSMYREAIDVYDKMVSNGFDPNRFTFQVILEICDSAGFVDDARYIFNSMSTRYKIKPFKEHYNSIIGLLTRLGSVDEAQRYVHMRSSMA